MPDGSASAPAEPAAGTPLPPVGDQAHQRGTVDLLGLVAYGELSAFQRLAADAAASPTLADRVQLSAMAATEFEHFRHVSERLDELGVDVLTASAPFRVSFDTYHSFTAPRSWLEGLVSTYVGDGFAADFYGEVATFVDPRTRACVHRVLADSGRSDYLVARVRDGVTQDPKIAGRLALWGRRLVGEALSQAQRVAADRDDLSGLLAGTVERPGLDLAATSRMFARLVDSHTERMKRLGLDS